MNILKAEYNLSKLVGGYNIYQFETNKANEFVSNYKELIKWCKSHDEVVFLINESIDVQYLKFIFYSVDTDDVDILAFIILMDNNNIYAYGYSGD